MAIVHDFDLDVRGEACPYPLIRTKQQVDKLQKGEVLRVLANLRKRIILTFFAFIQT